MWYLIGPGAMNGYYVPLLALGNFISKFKWNLTLITCHDVAFLELYCPHEGKHFRTQN